MSVTPPRLAARPEAADDDPPVRLLMTGRVVGIVPDASVAVALRLMVDTGVRHLPVMAGHRCVGLLRETDVVLAPASITVAEVCRPAPTLRPADRRSNAARVMHTAGTDAVVVLDGTHVVGIVTATDVVRSLAAATAGRAGTP